MATSTVVEQVQAAVAAAAASDEAVTPKNKRTEPDGSPSPAAPKGAAKSPAPRARKVRIVNLAGSTPAAGGVATPEQFAQLFDMFKEIKDRLDDQASMIDGLAEVLAERFGDEPEASDSDVEEDAEEVEDDVPPPPVLRRTSSVHAFMRARKPVGRSSFRWA